MGKTALVCVLGVAVGVTAIGAQGERRGSQMRPPERLTYVPPVYPKVAQRARVQGVVVLKVVIGPDGKIESTKVLRSIPLLDDAAVQAVRQWTYKPTTLNGAPIAVVITVTVNFSLAEPKLAAHSCDDDQALRSRESPTPTSVRFANHTSTAKQVYSLDAAGAKRLIRTIDPGANDIESTSVGHSWMVTDAQDTCMAVFVSDARFSQASLGNEDAEAASLSGGANPNPVTTTIDITDTYGTLEFRGSVDRLDLGDAYEFRTRITATFRPAAQINRTAVAELRLYHLTATVPAAPGQPWKLLHEDTQPIAVQLKEDGETKRLPDLTFRLSKSVSASAAAVGLGVSNGQMMWPISIDLR